jgi:membrane peptidoglycan carboxypeptidase
VWVGYRGSNKPLVGIEGVGAVFGGTLPAAIWKDFMTTATRRLPPHDWPEPKKPMAFQAFKATTSFGYNPKAPPAPPATPAHKPKKAKPNPSPTPDPSVPVQIAPQNG